MFCCWSLSELLDCTFFVCTIVVGAGANLSGMLGTVGCVLVASLEVLWLRVNSDSL